MNETRGGLREARDAPDPASRPARLGTQPLQGVESPPATPENLFPKDIAANCHDLSVDEHYRIARMPLEEVKRRYIVRNVPRFVARVKAAIRFWDGVEA